MTFASRSLDTPPAAGIAYGSGHFVVVGPNGLIESSHDGHTWKRHETGVTDEFSGVVWTGQRFLVSGGRSGWTSPDGLAWSAMPATFPCRVAWAREGWLGLGFSPGGNVWRSGDFARWDKAAVPPGPSLNAVAFGDR